MPFIYDRATFRDRVNAGIQGKKGLLIDMDELLNEAVREVKTEVRIRSAKRRNSLVPNLYRDEFQYTCPSDLEGLDIIDIPQQAVREDGEFNLVPTEQFMRNKKFGDIAIDDFNGIRVLLINSRVVDSQVVVDPLSQLAVVGGTWATFGDGTALAANSDDYVRGNASLEFDINAAAGTMAGIQVTKTIGEDLSAFIAHSAAIFVNARITSATGITNYKLRLGTSVGAYYEYTVTLRSDGTAFAAGWNTLRFDLTTPSSTVGSPDATNVKYIVLYMTKSTGKVSEAGYMFNWLVAKKGKYADVSYYSKYGWYTAAGAFIENSTADTDLLVADTDEFDLFVKKARVLGAYEADIPIAVSRSGAIVDPRVGAYDRALAQYKLRNPDESKLVISSYYDYGSRDPSDSSNGFT